MIKTNNKMASGRSATASAEYVDLERALEGLFRLGANRRFDSRQAAAVGAAVTRAGYAVLRSLADGGAMSLAQVASASTMDSATASRQVMQLVDDGLIDRRSAPDDARSIELTLTERGREAYERIVEYRLAHLGTALDDWSAADRAVLSRLVTRLAAGLAAAPPPTLPMS
jgi:DNA-binding MarR family transcriptional regulator